MVIMSFRFSKKKLVFIVGIFLFAITAVLFGGKLIGAVQQTAVQSKVKSEKILGGTEEERQKFIRSFGWEVAEEPLTVMEVKIPEEFDSVYEEYNNLQKTQGMDLTKYQGKRCKKSIFGSQLSGSAGACRLYAVGLRWQGCGRRYQWRRRKWVYSWLFDVLIWPQGLDGCKKYGIIVQ